MEQEKIEFEYQGKNFYLTNLGDDYYQKYLYFDYSVGRKKFLYKNCNFYSLTCDDSYLYTEELHNHVNEVINDAILSGQCVSSIISIEPRGEFEIDNSMDKYYHDGVEPITVSNSTGDKTYSGKLLENTPAGYILPHLLVAGMSRIPFKKFQNALGIKKVTITSNISTIGEAAFSGCLNLEEVVFENGVQEIKDYAFSETKIEKIKMPESLLVLGNNVFKDTLLNHLTVYANLKKVGVNDIRVYHVHGKSIRLEDGVSDKTILILYDDTKSRSYLEEYSFTSRRCRKVYREKDIETGKWRYFSATGKEYKNIDTYHQYPEFSWHVEYPSLQQAENLKRHFSRVSECKFDYHNCLLEPVIGWVAGDILLIPESLKSVYQDFLDYKNVVDKYQKSLKDISDLEMLKTELLNVQEEVNRKASELSSIVDTDNYYLSSSNSDILPNDVIKEMSREKSTELFKVKKI